MVHTCLSCKLKWMCTRCYGRQVLCAWCIVLPLVEFALYLLAFIFLCRYSGCSWSRILTGMAQCQPCWMQVMNILNLSVSILTLLSRLRMFAYQWHFKPLPNVIFSFLTTVKSSNIYFLDSPEGKEFRPVYRNLRLQHVINDLSSTKIVEQDCIVPKCEKTQFSLIEIVM